jgi:hypothetical protein
LNELRNLFNTARRSSTVEELDECLNNFSSLVQVADIPSNIKAELKTQIEVFQRTHLMNQFNVLISEAADIFYKKRFER